MSKPSKRPSREHRDVHAAIRTAAAELKAAPTLGYRDAAAYPEVSDLLHACRDAVSVGAPRFIDYKGRVYWLRVRLAAQIEVFAAPGDAEPLLSGASFSSDEHGHHGPGH